MAKDNPAVEPDTLSSSLVIDILANPGRAATFVAKVRDPEQVAAEIALRDLNATSRDDLLGESKMIAGKNYVDKGFALTSVEWQESTFEGGEGLPFYAVLHGVTPDGESVTIGCGAKTVVRRAALMDIKGWCGPDAWVKITRGKRLESGNYALDLVGAKEFAPFERS
jgi:hypothetical protein